MGGSARAGLTVGLALGSCGVALESSPENPQPLRRITAAVRGWIDRLGPVWVEAQLIEINRRSPAGPSS